MVSFVTFLEERQWQKFRAPDFLSRFEGGQGWGVIGGWRGRGSEEERHAPAIASPRFGSHFCRSPNTSLQSKLIAFAVSLFWYCHNCPQRVALTGFLFFLPWYHRTRFIAHRYQNHFILTPNPGIYRFQETSLCFSRRLRQVLALGRPGHDRPSVWQRLLYLRAG